MAVASKNIPAPDLVPVRRALISVSDKTGLIDFASALFHRGVDLISTGGSAKAIKDAGATEGRALAVDRDGRIVIAGVTPGGLPVTAVVYRLRPNGSTDRKFNP